ncbi:MAG: FmdB family zinc ribbon protein [Thermodesulfobacteriota bacterium]
MPIYGYRCLDCGSWDQRVAGLDDDTAICTKCGGLMLRVADNIWDPYFKEISDLLEETITGEGLGVGGSRVDAGSGHQDDQPGTFADLSPEVRERARF